MLPKTYSVRLRLFNTFIRNPYIFYVHAENQEEALSWVERVFTGIDTRATRKRWAEPAPRVPRVGSSEAVAVRDCDLFRNKRVQNGKHTVIASAPGSFRRTSQEVSSHLLKVFNFLQEDRAYLLNAASSLQRHMDQGAVSACAGQARVELLCQLAEPVLTWQDNLWREYVKLETRRQRNVLSELASQAA